MSGNIHEGAGGEINTEWNQMQRVKALFSDLFHPYYRQSIILYWNIFSYVFKRMA